MFNNFFESDQIFMDNSFDSFQNCNLERNPYIHPKYPLYTIDALDSVSNINLGDNNFESSLIIGQDNSNIKTNINTNSNNLNASKNMIKKKPGRKPKNEPKAYVHTKDSEDNIIRKIKNFCMAYLEKRLNNSLKKSVNFTYKKFYKLNTKINVNLRKDYNVRLMNMTIREIYEENIPSQKYSPSVNKKNYNLIQDIYDKNEEKETIEILSTKYIDFLNKLDTKEYIINEIEKKVKNSDKKIDDIISYMNKVRNLLENFQDWFTKKLDRNYKSKQNENNEKIKNN